MKTPLCFSWALLFGAVAISHDLDNVSLTLTEVAIGSALTDIQAPPDGTNRLFTLDIQGNIRILNLDDNTYEAENFMKVPQVVSGVGEWGAYSIAFHPDFGTNGHFFVHYTSASGGFTVNRIARFTATSSTTADPESYLLIFEDICFSNFHFGGSICFGPDGLFYASIGDDLGNGDARGAFDFKGKILRLDVDNPDPGENYGIPAGNPFAAGPGFEKPEVYALGLRNTWKMSFDTTTGDLFVADVGEDGFEEISVINPTASPSAPYDFGWSHYEGNSIFDPFATPPADHTAPVHVYPHESLNRSITGGYVYRGTAHPRLAGVYLYGDYISGRVWGLAPDDSGGWMNRELHNFSSLGTTTFGQGNDGEVYVLSPPFIYRLGDEAVVPSIPFKITDFGINPSRRFSVTVSAPTGTAVSLQRFDFDSSLWETIGSPSTAAADHVILTDLTRLIPDDSTKGIYRAVTTAP